MSEIFTGLIGSYSQFFSLAAFLDVILSPMNWTIIGTLVVLEGLLSADNALVLAIMVKHLPEEQQKRALFYGIMGSYVFRFLAIGAGLYLIKVWWIKGLGALYLLWMAFQFFFLRKKEPKDKKTKLAAEKEKPLGFWRTVLTVEIMDIAFSIDSVLAAFGLSEQVWVLYLGGILGVLMMRGVAQFFLTLIERYPELETTAYIMIALIGSKMMGSTFGYHVSNLLFFGALITLFFSTFIIHHIRFRNSG